MGNLCWITDRNYDIYEIMWISSLEREDFAMESIESWRVVCLLSEYHSWSESKRILVTSCLSEKEMVVGDHFLSLISELCFAKKYQKVECEA